MNQSPDPARELALTWLLRTNDPDFTAWDEFTAWLEESPANADAYHRLVDSEAQLRPLVDAVTAAPPLRLPAANGPSRGRVAMAASVALLAGVGALLAGPRLMPVDYSTAAGEMRTIALDDGDRLVMNGDTRLSLHGFNRRSVKLERGELLLQLHAASGRGVEVQAGDLKLVDIGTVFEVARDGNATRVAVSEGAVLADPDGARLQLRPGQQLATTDGAELLLATPIAAMAVGAFARGQLVYADQSLDVVIADLRRTSGLDISAGPGMSARRFSGTLSIAEVKRDPKSLEPLLGVALQRSGRGWIIGGKG